MKYLKKPIPVDAWQINILSLIGGGYPEWVHDAHVTGKIRISHDKTTIVIDTLEGPMTAKVNDYLIKGPMGEYWFNKKHIFEEMYEIWSGDYEYDTGRPIRDAKPKNIGTFEIVEVKENADGSANYEFILSEDVKQSLIRIAIRTALEDAVKKGDEWKVKSSDEQPETGECGWADYSVQCDNCDCWKNDG